MLWILAVLVVLGGADAQQRKVFSTDELASSIEMTLEKVYELLMQVADSLAPGSKEQITEDYSIVEDMYKKYGGKVYVGLFNYFTKVYATIMSSGLEIGYDMMKSAKESNESQIVIYSIEGPINDLLINVVTPVLDAVDKGAKCYLDDSNRRRRSTI